jgi:mannose-6-phosphate isomerase-like protein (cupin superfamily)
MILVRAKAQTKVTGGSHGGAGKRTATIMLGDYQRAEPGFKFLHDNLMEPGTTIGEHTHSGDEELWIILSGRATVVEDGRATELGPGDAHLLRDGGTHQLTVTGEEPVRMLVIGARTES